MLRVDGLIICRPIGSNACRFSPSSFWRYVSTWTEHASQLCRVLLTEERSSTGGIQTNNRQPGLSEWISGLVDPKT